MKIGIVGAEEAKWPVDKKDNAVQKVKEIIVENSYMNPATPATGMYVIVSGHCPFGGIDIWAEGYAKSLGIKTEIYPPHTQNWTGYKARNIRIAEAAEVLYCINPNNVWTGGSWTLKYFKRHFPDRKGVLIEL